MKISKWLLFSTLVPLFWGVWGSLTEIPEKWISPTFPATLGYVVWSLTMLPFAIIAFKKIAIFLMWGLQAYFVKSSANCIGAEGLFLYMTFTGIVLSPIAVLMANFSTAINWTITGPWLTALIQFFNALGCLLFVYAVRYGKAIIVVPMVNRLFPVVTIVLSVILYRTIPSRYNLGSMALFLIAVLLMAYDEVRHSFALEMEEGSILAGQVQP